MAWYESSQTGRMWFDDKGSGRPLVFIHGWCLSSEVWRLQQAALTDSFRVVTLDLPGHGMSSGQPEDFDFTRCAVSIAGLIVQLGLEDVVIIGWSLGALIAIETVFACSERISGLVLVSATPRFVMSPDFPYGLSQTEADGMSIKVKRSIARAREGFLSRLIVPGEDDTGFAQRLLSSVPVPTAETALLSLDELKSSDLRCRLPSINVATLILNGDRDVICLPGASDYILRQIPFSQQTVFSGCGHVPFLTQSSRFNDRLIDFLQQPDGGAYRQE